MACRRSLGPLAWYDPWLTRTPAPLAPRTPPMARRRSLGSPLADMIRADVKPALMAAIEGEFAKNPKEDHTPLRVSKADAAKRAAAAGGGSGKQGARGGSGLRCWALVQRVRVSKAGAVKRAAAAGRWQWQAGCAGLWGCNQLFQSGRTKRRAGRQHSSSLPCTLLHKA